MPDDPRGPLGGLPLQMAHRALRDIAHYGAEALRYFEAGEYDVANDELIKVRAAVRTLEKIRREQREAVAMAREES